MLTSAAMKRKLKNKLLPTYGMELPPEQANDMSKAHKLEVFTAVYIFTVVIVMYLAMSSSQAMKAAWVEDFMSIIPAITFLIAHRFYQKKPNEIFPYGFHRVFSIGFAIGSVTLLGIGLFIFFDSLMTLITVEHATIKHVEIFGMQVWFGWLMIAALVYSFVPTIILGRKKIPIAINLHNKLLLVDAETQKADWMTAIAAILGILGIGLGLWWADAVAAIFISFEITRDGFKRTSDVVKDFLGKIPTTIEKGDVHPINEDIVKFLETQDWIKDFRIRIREEGQIFIGEAFVIPKTEKDLIDNIMRCHAEIKKIDWKVHEIVIQPVREFEV